MVNLNGHLDVNGHISNQSDSYGFDNDWGSNFFLSNTGFVKNMIFKLHVFLFFNINAKNMFNRIILS